MKPLERIAWIDILKGICMTVIIMNHIPGESVLAARLTYPFELVGFFFVAGVTFSPKESFRHFMRAKFLRLVVPVFAFGVLNILLSIPFKELDVVDRIKGIFFQIPGQWDDMWFVACLFVMEIMYYPVARFVKGTWQKIAAALLGCGAGILWMSSVDMSLPWHVVNALLFLPFLAVGHVLKMSGQLSSFEQRSGGSSVSVLIPVALYCASVLAVRNWPVDVHLLQFGNALLFAVSAVTGLWSVVAVSVAIGRSGSAFLKQALMFIGANTLVFYGLQSKAISVFDAAFTKFGAILPAAHGQAWIPVLVCVLPVLAMASLAVNRWVPFMTGNFKHSKI